MEPLKKRKTQRFYFPDYLFWLGQKFNQRYRSKFPRLDGTAFLDFYLTAFILMPLMLSLLYLFPAHVIAVLIITLTIALCGSISIEIMYDNRKKEVMKRYSRYRFNPFTAWLLMLLPFAILLILFSNIRILE